MREPTPTFFSQVFGIAAVEPLEYVLLSIMDISSFQPNLPPDLGIANPHVNKSARSQSPEAAQAANAGPRAGETVKNLTRMLEDLPEVREESVEKGKRLLADPDFPNADQWTALARALVRDGIPDGGE